MQRTKTIFFYIYIYPLLPSYVFDNKHIPLSFFYTRKKTVKKTRIISPGSHLETSASERSGITIYQ